MTSALDPTLARGGFLVVDLDRFQGPLDLLLHLIRQQDIDVFDIPIARITNQFLAAIGGMTADDLDNAGEFMEMAATLIRIKAQMLLPRREEDDDEDPRAELVRRLLEYEQIREVANRLAHAEAERSRQIGKGYLLPRPRPSLEDVPLESTWDEVFAAALEVETPHPRNVDHRVSTRPIAMEDKIRLILASLGEDTRVRFSALLEPWAEKMHGVMTLLAGLELGRRRWILLRQARPFAELWLYRREDGDELGEIEATRAEGPAGDEAPSPVDAESTPDPEGDAH